MRGKWMSRYIKWGSVGFVGFRCSRPVHGGRVDELFDLVHVLLSRRYVSSDTLTQMEWRQMVALIQSICLNATEYI